MGRERGEKKDALSTLICQVSVQRRKAAGAAAAASFWAVILTIAHEHRCQDDFEEVIYYLYVEHSSSAKTGSATPPTPRFLIQRLASFLTLSTTKTLLLQVRRSSDLSICDIIVVLHTLSMMTFKYNAWFTLNCFVLFLNYQSPLK